MLTKEPISPHEAIIMKEESSFPTARKKQKEEPIEKPEKNVAEKDEKRAAGE